MDQEHEDKQLHLESEISTIFQTLYDDLQLSDREDVDEIIGHLAVAKAKWDREDGSFDKD